MTWSGKTLPQPYTGREQSDTQPGAVSHAGFLLWRCCASSKCSSKLIPHSSSDFLTQNHFFGLFLASDLELIFIFMSGQGSALAVAFFVLTVVAFCL